MDTPVALITGAGRGIGRAAAVAIANVGYRVALNSRSVEALEETRSLAGGDCLVVGGDVADSQVVNRVVQQTVDHFGRLDAVVHCAGLAPVLGVEETTDDDWRRTIDTNLSAAFYLARAAWGFLKQHGGVIVNISSVAGVDPFPGFIAYGAAKAGVNTLGLSLARQGQEVGIRVHTIAPGAVETAMFRRIMSPEQYSSDLTLRPEDVADVIVACVRGDLRYTSGEVITLRKTR
jgi:NAD(P)-dependent dehydrogenase (short-subunit alcohol dehydrogenase family)